MVSVILTSYNREKYIRESIESILCQTYKNYELIIVDDASVDRTKEIIKEYESVSNVIVVYNEHNLGEYRNRNKAASFAKGEFIKYLDSDDVMAPDCLQTMVDKMEKYPNAALGLISFFDEKMHINREYLQPNELYRQFYFKGNLINCGPSATIIRKKQFEDIGGFNLSPYLSDTDLLLRVCAKYSAVIFSSRLVHWRRHPEQEYAYGLVNNYYKNNAFSNFKKHLESKDNPLSEFESNMAVRNLKNRHCRKILKDFLFFDFKSAYFYINLYELTIFDLLISLRPNRYPSVI